MTESAFSFLAVSDETLFNNAADFWQADNPGQILWAIHQHWLLACDEQWLRCIFPSIRKIASMIRYYLTVPGPHWRAPARWTGHQELKPGSCEGFHPEYTEAFDIPALRAAIPGQAAERLTLAESLFAGYDAKSGSNLPMSMAATRSSGLAACTQPMAARLRSSSGTPASSRCKAGGISPWPPPGASRRNPRSRLWHAQGAPGP